MLFLEICKDSYVKQTRIEIHPPQTIYSVVILVANEKKNIFPKRFAPKTCFMLFPDVSLEIFENLRFSWKSAILGFGMLRFMVDIKLDIQNGSMAIAKNL